VSLHAFVDESRRNNTYLLAAAVVSPGQLRQLRMGLRVPNQRELHFKSWSSRTSRLSTTSTS
jgi:hypothetical protein